MFKWTIRELESSFDDPAEKFQPAGRINFTKNPKTMKVFNFLNRKFSSS